ncbi:hypothetical protein OG612_35200 [Streptomyces sp. NBC_01527]|uniref:hypothetical protein n=1 Tax=unclassified Streptomyces TaxID=2593676 RepID=UPI002E1412E0|nr:hypothetical protein OG763_07680 [Streptomyces sp. NBC_01230]
MTGISGPARHLRGLLAGAAAGAAGCTVLDAVGYLDMVIRGRGASTTPEVTVARLSKTLHVRIPGDENTRENRVEGLGPLTGMAAGVGMGALLGLALSCGWRPGNAVLTATATTGALIGTNGPMTVLRVTDPRTWSRSDWVADLVPHVAYALVTVAVVRGLEPGPPDRTGAISTGVRECGAALRRTLHS